MRPSAPVRTAAFVVLAGVAGAGGWFAYRASQVPDYAEVRAIVDRHCIGCHAEETTVPAFPVAGGGLKLDTYEQMAASAQRMQLRVVVQRNMPMLNKTGMTDEERAVVDAWVAAGAPGP